MVLSVQDQAGQAPGAARARGLVHTQLLAQTPGSLEAKGPVDLLVTDTHGLVVGVGRRAPPGSGRPPQAGVTGDLQRAGLTAPRNGQWLRPTSCGPGPERSEPVRRRSRIARAQPTPSRHPPTTTDSSAAQTSALIMPMTLVMPERSMA